MLASQEVRSRGQRDVARHSKPSGKWARTAVTSVQDKQCFNVWDTDELNCVSGVYHRHALEEILAFLDREVTPTVMKPCALAAYLADLGYITRGAVPGLVVIADKSLPTRSVPAFAEVGVTEPQELCVDTAV